MSLFEGSDSMYSTLVKVVRVLEKIEKDLSGIKEELTYIRKQKGAKTEIPITFLRT